VTGEFLSPLLIFNAERISGLSMSNKNKSPQKSAVKHKRQPQRTCIICRQKFDKRRLTRLVNASEEGIVVDPTGKRNGRGAYLCDDPACWQKTLQNSTLLAAALKTEVSLVDKATIAAAAPQVKIDK
jgi:predicted RNA-binding protein YlxR (DUF448 family)